MQRETQWQNVQIEVSRVQPENTKLACGTTVQYALQHSVQSFMDSTPITCTCGVTLYIWYIYSVTSITITLVSVHLWSDTVHTGDTLSYCLCLHSSPSMLRQSSSSCCRGHESQRVEGRATDRAWMKADLKASKTLLACACICVYGMCVCVSVG